MMIGEQIIVPDLAQKLTAYRTWELLDNKLIPLSRVSCVWNEGVQEAECRPYKYCTEPPTNNCSCGLYGFFQIDKAVQQSLGVVGVTEHWGRTEIHEDGLRSQYASIKALSYAPIKRTPLFFERNIIARIIILSVVLNLFIVGLLSVLNIVLGTGITPIYLSFFFCLSIVVSLILLSVYYYPTRNDYKMFTKLIKDVFRSQQKKKQFIKDYCSQHNILYVEDYHNLAKYCDSSISQATNLKS